MKTRSGVTETQAFGPALPSETRWLITPRKAPIDWLLKNDSAYRVESDGHTAFEACARIGMSLSEVIDIRPMTESQ